MESSANEFPAIVGQTKTQAKNVFSRISRVRQKRTAGKDYPERSGTEKNPNTSVVQERLRPLTSFELAEVKKIFGTSLLYEKIVIADTLGTDHQPCLNYSNKGEFIIHAGAECFAFGAFVNESCMNSIVHQLVHVWQQCHGQPPNLDTSSGCCHESKELNFRAGLHWENYSREQQALLIEEWFDNGMQETDPRFQYVKNNLQAAP